MLRESATESTEEMALLKILQTMMTYLNPSTISLSVQFVNEVMQTTLQISEHKSKAVKSISQAMTRQLITILLDKFISECKQKIPTHQDFFSQSTILPTKLNE